MTSSEPTEDSMAKRTPEVLQLTEGPVEDRAAVVLNALREGWSLLQGEPYGAHFVDPEDGGITVVPRDVMEHLADEGVIRLKRHQ